MTKKQKIYKNAKSSSLKVTHPDTAGIDVGKDLMQVSVPLDRDEQSNRCFKTTTGELKDIITWLMECGIRRVVMESTGIYWIPLFLMIQEAGMEAILVNAKEVKNLAAKKSDVADADWLRFLGSCDLIKPCYQMEAVARRLREYSRQRMTKVKDMAREVQHMQKALEKMNIKLDSVLRDVVGKSGRAIIDNILKGERDANTLASFADGRCGSSPEDFAKALEGTWDPEHLFSLKQAVETYDFLSKQIEECDQLSEAFLNSYEIKEEYDHNVDGFVRSGKKVSKKHKIGFDVEAYAYQMFGVNIMRVPGISQGALLTMMTELGPGFHKKFPTARKFCRWCNLVPDNKVTGGRVVSSHIPKRPNPVGQALRQSAATLYKADNALGIFFRRQKSKKGSPHAIVATANKLAEIIYIMISRHVEYDEKKTSDKEKDIIKKRIEQMKKRLKKLEALENEMSNDSAGYRDVI